jgi:hypothetical protein
VYAPGMAPPARKAAAVSRNGSAAVDGAADAGDDVTGVADGAGVEVPAVVGTGVDAGFEPAATELAGAVDAAADGLAEPTPAAQDAMSPAARSHATATAPDPTERPAVRTSSMVDPPEHRVKRGVARPTPMGRLSLGRWDPSPHNSRLDTGQEHDGAPQA